MQSVRLCILLLRLQYSLYNNVRSNENLYLYLSICLVFGWVLDGFKTLAFGFLMGFQFFLSDSKSAPSQFQQKCLINNSHESWNFSSQLLTNYLQQIDYFSFLRCLNNFKNSCLHLLLVSCIRPLLVLTEQSSVFLDISSSRVYSVNLILIMFIHQYFPDQLCLSPIVLDILN